MPEQPEQVKLAVIYYSSTGTIDDMARHAAAVGEKAGADVRLRQVEELAPREAIESQEEWKQHVDATREEPSATPDDVVWADAVRFGSPTRFGNVASQLGYTDPLKFVDGNPYGVSHATGADNDEPLGDAEEDAIDHLVERLVTVTDRLLRGRASA